MSAPASPEIHGRESTFAGSPSLDGLVNPAGERWEAVRRRLAPRYARAWRAIALCYAALFGGTVAHALLATRAPAVGLASVPLAALWVGYWLNALINFIHEGAHFNLHRDKRLNDRLTNLLLCPLAGTEVAHYRDFHWPHHLYLGSARDTEVSYRTRPGLRFAARALFGADILAVVRRRRQSDVQAPRGRSHGQAFGLVRAALVHGAIIGALIVGGRSATALAWVIGAAMVYPLCNALRQILEHRPVDADRREGAQVGAVNRMFGTGVLARTFGSAGFNRHLLHHWYPAASYTCFDEIEAFLGTTSLKPVIDAARTTYGATWRALLTGPTDQR